jgi:hypothetical protein
MPFAGTPLAWLRLHQLVCIGSRMVNMLTAPGLTLLFLGIVVGLGTAFVWMLWEIEQTSKPHRDGDRVN